MNKRIVNRVIWRIDQLGLDLTGEIVLTEVGFNNYLYTPIIPALARAKKVFAWVKDSSFGDADSIINSCNALAGELGCSDLIEFFKGDFCREHLEQATIITNSGFLRPLDKNKLKWVREEAVIPLMFEAWELRGEDIDIEYAKQKGIKIAGTWENHPNLEVFKHVGPLALKMVFEAGYEVFNNNILVWSNDEFGEEAAKAFKLAGANSVLLTDEINRLKNLKEIDFIFFCHYKEVRSVHDILLKNIHQKKLSNLGIIHLYGDLNFSLLKNRVYRIYPEKDGYNKTMSFTLSHVGINPLIDLLVSGFKVGQLLRSNKIDSLVQII